MKFEEQSRARLTKGIALVVFSILVAFIPIDIYRQDFFGAGLLSILAVVASIGFYLVHFKGKTLLASNLILAICIFAITGFMSIEGGIFAPAMIWITCIPILATFLVGVKQALFWTIGCVFLSFSVCLWEALNGYPNRLDDNALVITLFASLVMAPICTMALASLFERYKRQMSEVLNESNEKLTSLTESLSEVVQEKQALIAVVCHDIATPLMTIMTNVAIMDELFSEESSRKIKTPSSILFPKFEKGIGKIEQASFSINEAISLTREMMAMESGKLEVHLEKLNLIEVIKKVQRLFSDRLEKKKIRLEIHAEMADFYVIAEERALIHSVLGNLVSNSIKFSPENGLIQIFVSKDSDSNISVTVRDKGEGIPQQVLRNLFSWKTVTTRKGTMGEKGTGFGMPAVKAWMKCFKGKLMVKSYLHDAALEVEVVSIQKRDNVEIDCKSVEPSETGAEITLVFPKVA